jgi:norsolorinic acid ketoreductase
MSWQGIADYFGTLIESPLDMLHEHIEVNGIGPLILYKGTHAVLSKSQKPKFILISGLSACMMNPLPGPMALM